MRFKKLYLGKFKRRRVYCRRPLVCLRNIKGKEATAIRYIVEINRIVVITRSPTPKPINNLKMINRRTIIWMRSKICKNFSINLIKITRQKNRKYKRRRRKVEIRSRY